MKLSLLPLIAFPLAVSGSHLKRATEVRRQVNNTGGVYTTDLFQGTNLKQQESSLNNSDLVYTQRNGKQYFQPLGAQRAGEKGPLLLQDVHMIDTVSDETTGAFFRSTC